MATVDLTPYPTDGLLDRLGIGKREVAFHSVSSFDIDMFEDKFWGDAILGQYPAAKTNGTSAAVTFTEHNQNAYLDLVSGTTQHGYAGQGMGLQFTGDRGVLAEFIMRTPSSVADLKFECGLSDADDDAGAVNQKAATTTATAADFGVFVVDTTDDANIAFVSANGGTVSTTQDIMAVAANTTYRFAVRVTNNDVVGYINGTVVATHGSGIEGGSKLTPWTFCQARAADNSRTMQLHKWRVQQPAY